MNKANTPRWIYTIAPFLTALQWGCAVPAIEVAVPTMPMRQALELSRIEGGSIPAIARDAPHPVASESVVPTRNALMSAPDVRLGYLYEWIDAEGNKHYGEWVAIPITGFNWIMSDGSHAPLDSATHEAKPAQDGR